MILTQGNRVSDFDSIYLRLDTTNGPVTGELAVDNNIIPFADTAYDIGNSTNRFRTIFLNYNGGNAIEFPTGQGAEEVKNYRFDMGGGSLLATDQNCSVEFGMDACINNTENEFIIDVGNVYWAGATNTNDFIIRSYNGIDNYQFLSAFGGFNNPEYGWALQRIVSLGETTGKTLFFDNQTPISDFRRSIDFRIDGANKVSIENTGEVIFTDRLTTPRADITAIQSGSGFGNAGVAALTTTAYLNFFGLNWFDYLTINAQSTNLPSCLGMFPNGTGTASYINAYNSSNTGATAWLEMGIRGSIAELVCRDFSQTTNITDLNIGSGGNDFPVFDVTCSTLTDINCIGTQIGTAANQKIGVWGATPIVRPTITGSRGGNAAVASIATAGANIGLWIDNTTP
jgi:hypothetical protein